MFPSLSTYPSVPAFVLLYLEGICLTLDCLFRFIRGAQVAFLLSLPPSTHHKGPRRRRMNKSKSYNFPGSYRMCQNHSENRNNMVRSHNSLLRVDCKVQFVTKAESIQRAKCFARDVTGFNDRYLRMLNMCMMAERSAAVGYYTMIPML